MEKSFFKREELIGKLVIDQKAEILGKIEDIALTVDGKTGLLIQRDGNGDELIMLIDIKRIGDVVLLRDESDTEPSSIMVPDQDEPKMEPAPPEKVEENVCPSCGHGNRETVKFCVKCGKSLR